MAGKDHQEPVARSFFGGSQPSYPPPGGTFGPPYPDYPHDVFLLAKLGQAALIIFIILAIMAIVVMLVVACLYCCAGGFGGRRADNNNRAEPYRADDHWDRNDAGVAEAKAVPPGRKPRRASSPQSDSTTDRSKTLSYYEVPSPRTYRVRQAQLIKDGGQRPETRPPPPLPTVPPPTTSRKL